MQAGEMLRELAAVILDSATEGDLWGHLQVWAGLVDGRIDPDVRIIMGAEGPRPLSEREVWVLGRLAEAGRVTSSDVARQFGVTNETGRETLQRMAADGLVRPHSDRRGRWYGGTAVRMGIGTAAE
jgi:hypothetical protein